MLTLFKDIFWQDQFRESSTEGVISQPEKLDRDRYFIGLSLLSSLLWINIYSAPFLYPSSYSGFMDDNSQLINTAFNLFSPHIGFDIVILMLSVLLSWRAFGRWLAIPAGVITFFHLSTITMIPGLKYLDSASYSSTYIALIVYGVLLLIWLIFQVWMLTRPGLKRSQPEHPLVRLNPKYPANKQLTAVQYMWFFMALGTAVVISSALLSTAIYIFGRYLDLGPLIAGALFIGAIALVASLVIVVKRLRNLGKKPMLWTTALIGIPLVFASLQGYIYNKNFFDLAFVFLIMYFVSGIMRFAIVTAQVYLLLESCKETSKEPAQTPEDSNRTTEPNLMSELSTRTSNQ